MVGYPDRYKFLLHDRDSIFASHLDESIGKLGVRVSKSAPRCPKGNAVCERVLDTICRECLDWLIPLSESHLRSILKSWITHYNRGRPHMALGPGVPDPPAALARSLALKSRHGLSEGVSILGKPVLAGLHHEYSFGTDGRVAESLQMEAGDRVAEFLRTTGVGVTATSEPADSGGRLAISGSPRGSGHWKV